MSFPLLNDALGASDALVFFDFEATQFSHKAISLGIVLVPRKPGPLTLKSFGKPLTYQTLILTEDNIGHVVTQMTGLTRKGLSDSGKPFATVVKEVRNLLRPYHEKSFISYGPGDITIFRNTVDSHLAFESDLLRTFEKHYFDFYDYLRRYLVDNHGQALSIHKLLDHYQIRLDGKEHDSLFDAEALFEIFSRFIAHEEQTAKDILNCYEFNHSLEDVNRKLARKVLTTGKATTQDLLTFLKESL